MQNSGFGLPSPQAETVAHAEVWHADEGSRAGLREAVALHDWRAHGDLQKLLHMPCKAHVLTQCIGCTPSHDFLRYSSATGSSGSPYATKAPVGAFCSEKRWQRCCTCLSLLCCARSQLSGVVRPKIGEGMLTCQRGAPADNDLHPASQALLDLAEHQLVKQRRRLRTVCNPLVKSL